MKKYIQNIGAVLFLTLCLPYTMTLLMNGRDGIHTEQELPELEYFEVRVCEVDGDLLATVVAGEK